MKRCCDVAALATVDRIDVENGQAAGAEFAALIGGLPEAVDATGRRNAAFVATQGLGQPTKSVEVAAKCGYVVAMTAAGKLEIFLVSVPGLEAALCDEAREKRFASRRIDEGGVTVRGTWREVWRANLELRGASRVLVRLGSFRAPHLAQLDRRARTFPWRTFLRSDVPVRVEAVCRKSRIYHSGAAAQRIAAAISEELGAPIAAEADVCIKARIEDDLCTISVDTSGGGLHKRGHKQAVGRAPMRETLASLFLRRCGFDGREPVVDPMCGSGTFAIEAAEIAAGLDPGRSRHFAFEQLATFEPAAWKTMQDKPPLPLPSVRFFGRDRDDGAIRMARANAERAGVAALVDFRRQAISDLEPPEGPPGLVIVNPPYGTRIGSRKPLFGLYGALGATLRARFAGWRVGLVTADAALAKATGLPFAPPGPPVSHGGLSVVLFITERLP